MCGTALLLAGTLAVVPPAAAGMRGTPGGTRFLLALGDSLAAGYQPTDGRTPPPVDPATGRADQGYPGSYPADLAHRYRLALADLACPGETSASFASAPAEKACANSYRQWFGVTDQEAAAGRFLAEHRGKVALVTIDIGANDLDGCATPKSVDFGCLAAGERSIATQVPRILAFLKAHVAADDPGTPVVSMNYYDPFLAAAFAPGGASGAAEATASVGGLEAVNGTLLGIDTLAHVLDADVASAFRTGKVLPMRIYGGRILPLDVATVCQLTWMCPTAGSAVRHPDIHPRTIGYAVIESAFTDVLAKHHIRL